MTASRVRCIGERYLKLLDRIAGVMSADCGRREPFVEGRPELRIRDEDREAVADMLANILLAALAPESTERAS